MICPNCGYKDITYVDDGDIEGYLGNFYTLPIEMAQAPTKHSRYSKKIVRVFGCPECNSLFMAEVLDDY
jgi:predicted RNA-binding Zn-ribbon protein involved in translation (DUF1610 family)